MARAAAWQSAPLDHQAFFSDYARLMYAPSVAPEVTAALKDLTESELDLQKVLGDEYHAGLVDGPLFSRQPSSEPPSTSLTCARRD